MPTNQNVLSVILQLHTSKSRHLQSVSEFAAMNNAGESGEV
jgi:hypothetical protein